MQFKRALVGALLGAAVGMGVLVVAYFLFGAESTWLAIVVALAVGFGVRAMVSTKGHASYVRGALTGVLAIAAFAGGKLLIADLATRQMTRNAGQPVRIAAPPAGAQQRMAGGEAGDSADESNKEDDQAEVDVQKRTDAPRIGNLERVPMHVGRSFSTLDFILISLAALIAYELGRGSGTAPSTASSADPTPQQAAPSA